jgi:hypothetical protein
VSTFEWLAAAGNKEEWRQQAKQILHDEEMKQCTFKPDLPNNKADLSKSTITTVNDTKLSGNT